MTREEYIALYINAAKNSIRQNIDAAGKKVEYWDKSWEPTEFFPEIFWGQLYNAYGLLYDREQEINALKPLIQANTNRLNTIYNAYNLLYDSLITLYPRMPLIDLRDPHILET